MSESDFEYIKKKFLQVCFTLSRNDILEMSKKDNGPVNNVVANIREECYGVQVFETMGSYDVEIFYVTNNDSLKGDILCLKLDDPDYFNLLLQFCHMLSVLYPRVDAIDAFNTFQSTLRSFLEKLGYFTITPAEIKPYKGKNAVMMSSSPKGIKMIELIDKVEYYRKFFNQSYKLPITPTGEYVYLMVNIDTALIKIGFSKKPGYREKTLQSQEPKVHLIACWEGSKMKEKELHKKFHEKRIRGEWFRLNFEDLKMLENLMQ